MESVSNFHNFTNDLPESVAAELRACYRPREYGRNEIIFQGNDKPDRLFLLNTGSIALCNYAIDGQEVILTRYRPGDWFGVTGILDNRPRINTAIALEDTALQMLSARDFNRLHDKHPQIMRAVSVMQAYHIRLLLNLLVDASLLRLPARVARTIQRLLVSQGLQDDDGLNYIKCSHDELSRYLGASRQSTSIELKKLEHAGVVRSAYGKIFVLDKQALDDSCDPLTSFERVAPAYEDDKKADR